MVRKLTKFAIRNRGKEQSCCYTRKEQLAAAVFQIPVFQAFRMDGNDKELISLLELKNEAAFEHVFKTHFNGLHAYACSMLKDSALQLVSNARIEDRMVGVGHDVNAVLSFGHNRYLSVIAIQGVTASPKGEAVSHYKEIASVAALPRNDTI